MITIVVRSAGKVTTASALDPAWLGPGSDVVFWVDLSDPTPEEGRVLSEFFHFHELSIEDALATTHHPKIEAYESYLYVILHGIDFEVASRRGGFSTRDVDFFVGDRFLVTVHDGRSRSVAAVRDLCRRNGDILAEGPAGLMHRIVDTMVDNYRPEIDRLEHRIDELEHRVFTDPSHDMVRTIMRIKKDIVSLRQVVQPQRDVVSRLARREFTAIGPKVGFAFRDVYDHLVRIADESLMFQDRVTGLVEAHLSGVSNRLNSVMKILTVIATVFMPLTFITGLFGMNVALPHFGLGDDVMFWVLLLFMGGLVSVMLWFFRMQKWL